MNANFREAIKSGDKEAIEREGAKKLQSVWRIKQAQKEVQARKDAFLDAAARKVQSCYRIRYVTCITCRLRGCTLTERARLRSTTFFTLAQAGQEESPGDESGIRKCVRPQDSVSLPNQKSEEEGNAGPHVLATLC